MQSLLSSTEWLSKPRLVAGSMSGTSLDGIDVAIAEFSIDDSTHQLRFIASATRDFRDEERTALKSLIEDSHHISRFSDLQQWLSHETADLINTACASEAMKGRRLDAIGLHGQTLWHQPQHHDVLQRRLGATLQMISGSTVAQRCSCTTVSDFRSADVALGGQGAPLVPIFDLNFLSDPEHEGAALNIGGMANLTILPAKRAGDELLAFDTGPGNVWIDAAMERFYSRRFDAGGAMAFSGGLIVELFDSLREIAFVTAPPPKSTGRELFSTEFLRVILSSLAQRPEPQDVIHTLTAFTAWSIAENLRMFGSSTRRLIVSGGGIHNAALMTLLQKELPEMKVLTSDDVGIPSKWKESLCFAYLAFRTLGGLSSTVPSVSGASKEAILGQVAYV